MADELDPEAVSRVMREMGRKGGLAKVAKGFAKLTPAERLAAAKRSAEVRRANAAARKKGQP